MANLFRAFFFKLKKDLTFRVTLFIGLGLAVFMTLIYLAIDLGINTLSQNGEREWIFCTGQNLLITTLSPAQNFGLAIPINLITFTVLEFTQGTIRNKIIAGNSKTKIYFSLFFAGLVFTFSLMITYIGLCVGVSSIIGGFDANGMIYSTSGTATISPEFLWKIIVLAVLAYIVITAAAVFFATLFRSVGPCIPIVIILLMACYLSGMIIGLLGSLLEDNETAKIICTIIRYINPIFMLSGFSQVDLNTGATIAKISNEQFIVQVVNNCVYIAAFLAGGWAIFIKRDVK